MVLVKKLLKGLENRFREGYESIIKEIAERSTLYEELHPFLPYINDKKRTRVIELISLGGADLAEDVQRLYDEKAASCNDLSERIGKLKPYEADLVVFEDTAIKRLVLPVKHGIAPEISLHKIAIEFILGALKEWIPNPFPLDVFGYHAEEARAYHQTNWNNALMATPFELSILQISFKVERFPFPGFSDTEALEATKLGYGIIPKNLGH